MPAVRSVASQTWTDWEVLVLGQGDVAAEAAMRAAAAAAAPGDRRIRYAHLPARGLSRARNAALAETTAPVVAFLDDDCEADPRWLETIGGAFAADSRLGLVGGAVRPAGPVGFLSSCPTLAPAEALYDPAASPQRPPQGWDWIGANFALRRTAARLTGEFDIHLGGGAEFPAGEDTDYKLRMEALGVRMLTTPRSIVLHSSGTRSGRAAWRSQRNYALGNGALAAKQTLAGDPRGRRWRDHTRRDAWTGWMANGHVHRLPVDLRRALWFEVGYRRCLSRYEVDGGLLRPRPQYADGAARLDTDARHVPLQP
jgi:glycosyltransferase involved in cell wall biosynthesis